MVKCDGPEEKARDSELLRLEQLIRAEIPITHHLHFSLLSSGADGLVLAAPLQPNINHKGTAFGGSLSMLATLAGWGMVHLLLSEMAVEAAEVVIQKSSISFLKPVRQDFTVVCERPEAATLDAFRRMFDRKGRSRLHLCCRVQQGDELAMAFEGSYVAAADPGARLSD
jgi:thioesterase domain-containing protein